MIPSIKIDYRPMGLINEGLKDKKIRENPRVDARLRLILGPASGKAVFVAACDHAMLLFHLHGRISRI